MIVVHDIIMNTQLQCTCSYLKDVKCSAMIRYNAAIISQVKT